MNLTKMARQLLAISNDLRSRRKVAGVDHDVGELYDFDQVWPSTALGFPGIGGSRLTTERTFVFIPRGEYGEYGDRAFVYFGDRYAYECGINKTFWRHINENRMVPVNEKERYDQKEDDECRFV